MRWHDPFTKIHPPDSSQSSRQPKSDRLLAAWLGPIAKREGLILSAYVYPELSHLRQRAGVEDWPRNALRHSFASYHLARFKNAAELALEMGHVGNGLIFKHYRQVVRESAAIEYWNIFPEQPENVLRFSEQNVPRSRPLATRARSAETGRMVPMFQRPLAYKKTGRQYAGEMGVSIKTAEKWMRIGKPLDDPEALKRLDAGKYEMSVAQHAEAYSTTQFQIKIWRRAGWPLDNVEGVKIFLASRKQTALRSFNGPSNRAVRVIGLSPKDARIRPATPVAACRA